jgi:uncharacterized protein YjbI with pentapeptide repeats
MSTRPATEDLRADCARCCGLCCVAPAFVASADFAIDKPAGTPCLHLQPDSRCSIHQRLRPAGFPGCAAYDCFGAGQKVTQVTFLGRDWRESSETAEAMFRTFATMRDLHELLWYLTEALSLDAARPHRPELATARDHIETLTRQTPEVLAGLHTEAVRRQVDVLLVRVSALVRAGEGAGRDLRGADLVGKNLAAADLRGADLRGALLIGADLSGADLSHADVIGADLRACEVSGTNLRTCLFLTQLQANAATGNAATTLPSALTRPRHWGDDSTRSVERR